MKPDAPDVDGGPASGNVINVLGLRCRRSFFYATYALLGMVALVTNESVGAFGRTGRRSLGKAAPIEVVRSLDVISNKLPDTGCAAVPNAGMEIYLWGSAEPSWGTLTLDKETPTALPLPWRPLLDRDASEAFRNHEKQSDWQALASLLEAPGDEWQTFLASMGTGNPNPNSRVMTFRNAWCNDNGWIVDAETCAAVKNGGCVNWSPSSFQIPSHDLPVYDRVITIAAPNTGAVWHWVWEALAGLAAAFELDGADITSKQTYVHVTHENMFTKQWLALVGVSADRVITGNIYARELVVPEMGKCGQPLPYQTQWLANKTAASIATPTVRKTVVLVKRTQSRVLENHDEVEAFLRSFAASRGLDVHIHDDGRLPSVRMQLHSFAKAALVVAPHGAGLVNIVISYPGTPIIEFLDSSWLNTCFLRLATLLGHRYHGILMKPGRSVDIGILEETLLGIFPEKLGDKQMIEQQMI